MHARRSTSVAHLIATAALALPLASGTTSADQILEIYDASLTTQLYGSPTPVQNVSPIVEQRGVNVDGSLRSSWPQGFSFAGNTLGGSYNGNARIGDVALATGTYSPTEIDIALPHGLVIGRSYNGRQDDSGHHDSDGYQGKNWFQLAQPEIVLYDADSNPATLGDTDVLYIVYGADRFIEFKRSAADSKQFKGKNGTAGVVRLEIGATNEPDTYTYFDQAGNMVVFFGFDGDAGAAAGQFWKAIDPSGGEAGTIYVGDMETGSTAISNGYDGSGRITTAFDKASNNGRRYTFTYTMLDSVARLTRVLVESKTGGAWGGTPTGVTTITQVDYAYYQTGDNTYGDNGSLKQVTITSPMSDTGVNLVRKQHYRYYKGTFNASTNPGYPNAIKYFVDYEGYRRADWEEAGLDEPVLDDGPLSLSDESLKPYASAYFEYNSNRQIAESWFSGECGCSGGADGTYVFGAYDVDSDAKGSGYQPELEFRTIYRQPDNVYVTVYFDETAQSLSRVVTNAEPSTTPTKTWVTEVVRDSNGVVSAIHSPANNSTYTESTGAVTHSDSVGAVTEYERVSSGDMTGFLQAVKHRDGATGTVEYDSYFTYTSRGLAVGSLDVTRPAVSARRAYHTATSTASTSTAYDETAFTYAWHSATNTEPKYIAMKQVTTTLPKVPTTENGKGDGGADPAVETNRYFRPDGTTAFTQSPSYSSVDAEDREYAYTEVSADGLMTETIKDVDIQGDFQSNDDPQDDFGFPSFEGPALGIDVTSTMTYTSTLLVSETMLPTARITKAYHSVLKDGRQVRIDIPRMTSGGTITYYGPASYQVLNHAGKTEFIGTIALSSSGITTITTGWIDENDADPITALDVGTLFGMSTSVYSKSGAKLDESRMYFDIPASGAGTEGTNYDATFYGYDDMGRQRRVKDPTGTIRRSAFDDLGRTTEQWIGTNDSSFAGGESYGTDNMVKVSAVEYDSNADGGNSYITKRTAYVQDSTTDQRVTTFTNDYRGRAIVHVNAVAPHIVNKYDNLGRMVATGMYSSSTGLTASTDPTSTTTNRVNLSETFYDSHGRVWKTKRHSINQGTGASLDSLEVLNWYDAQGRLIKTDGEQLSKQVYDRLGRVTNVFILASENDAAGTNPYDEAGSLDADDIVLEERQSYYEDDSGNVLMSVSIERHWDDYSTGETTGALDTDSDLSLVDYAAGKIKGRAQITAMWYDDLDRQTDVVRYGTYGGGTNYDRDSESTPPARSDTALRTTTAYNDNGTVLSTTDPAGRERRTEYDDAGRATATIVNYVNGTPSGTTGDDDVYTRMVYTDGLQTKYWVDLDGDNVEDASDQVTIYTYGVTKGVSTGDSKVAAGHLLKEAKYPDSASASDVVKYAYNAQEQEVYRKDQAGNEVDTVYDTGGRVTGVKLTTVASGFDSTVRRIETAYTNRGQVSTVKQYDATSSGTLLDTVTYTYDAWGMLFTETPDHDSPAATGITVSYTYEKATTGRNSVRRTRVNLESGETYDGFSIAYTYSSTGDLHDAEASRVTAVVAENVTVAEYRYNGAAELIKTIYGEPDVFYSMDGASARSYDRLDRFNRPTSSIWAKDLATDVDFYDIDVTWDRNSNVTRVVDNIHFRATATLGDGRFDELYTIDGLNRLAGYERGHWDGSAIENGTETQGELWTLDQVGNWEFHKLDLTGDGDYIDANEFQEDRTHNVANELTDRDQDTDNDSSYDDHNWDMTYDAVGNMTDDGVNYRFVYDPLGRLIQIQKRTTQLISEYRYDGLGRRIAFRHDTDGDASMADEQWYHLIYDDKWRILAVYRADDDSPKEVFVWHAAGLDGDGSSSYIDTAILRDKDANTAWSVASDDALEERRYFCQNWRADVSVILTSAGRPVEWVKYDPYGRPFNIPQGDVDSDGDTDSADQTYETRLYQSTDPYDVRGDINLDGVIDYLNDFLPHLDLYFAGRSGGRGVLSRTDTANRLGYAGYVFDDEITRFAHVRHRIYDTTLGRWTRRDPMGYIDDGTLYQYADSKAIGSVDHLGLCTRCLIPSGIVSFSTNYTRATSEYLPKLGSAFRRTELVDSVRALAPSSCSATDPTISFGIPCSVAGDVGNSKCYTTPGRACICVCLNQGSGPAGPFGWSCGRCASSICNAAGTACGTSVY